MPKHTTSHAKNMRLAISFPPDFLYPGHDFLGVLWMLFTIVFLGVSTVGLFLRKISFCLCAQALEREMAESKAAYKQHRWEMRKKKRVPGRHMSEEPAQKRLCLNNAFWRDSGPHLVPVRSSSCIPRENIEKTKVNAGVIFTLPVSGHCSLFLSRPLLAWPLLCRFCDAFSVWTFQKQNVSHKLSGFFIPSYSSWVAPPEAINA
ncbi:uncharacterized protein LOC116546644 isoform X1 [Sapajus apella]|uniref:Uncharacterized protein LOC116546644 isoform X1 n=2 Tax=Sapajus apella TaxID=9515 RepID=A0A6J3HDZ8_SAPAP|nr:uncharacterized protein LOC116546644 isoform X1 [Sapajus apella]